MFLILRAHPRPCGEHGAWIFGTATILGSSPPVRGARYQRLRQPAGCGLIPARAGSTLWFSSMVLFYWAHPRPCGEHTVTETRENITAGSSPPVRGALASTLGLSISSGLIPARAGSTAMTIVFKLSQRAHPRPCGEHGSDHSTTRAVSGSSPPVRGAHRCAGLVNTPAGLIPARAGSTRPCPMPLASIWAHPRPCGEHPLWRRRALPLRGSSPPVRGARRRAEPYDRNPGLIPARAGSTSFFPRACCGVWAHPRPCGEHQPSTKPNL